MTASIRTTSIAIAVLSLVLTTLLFVTVIADPLSPEPHNYTNGSSALDIPIEIVEGHVTVPVRINNSRELCFALDCGIPFKGIDIAHMALADEFIPKSGRVDYSLPGIEFLNQRIVPIANEVTETMPEDGIIGLTLFATCVVELDFQAGRLNLYDPSAFDDTDKGEVLELTFRRGLPCVEVEISVDRERPSRCLLTVDLGSPGTLLLWPGGTCGITPPPEATEVVLGALVSGEMKGKKGIVASMRLGSHVVKNIPASFASKRYLQSAQPDIIGCVGVALLRRFTLTLDYSQQRLLIAPNATFDQPFTVPDPADSGSTLPEDSNPPNKP